MKRKQELAVIDGETLMDMYLPPTRFCVESLMPQGVAILGGAPKIGKSWMVLDLCVHVAKGEPIWNLPTQKGTVLYLSLEDPLQRLQTRLNSVTDEAPSNLFFATAAGTIESGLGDQIKDFVSKHADTVLVAVDTFQIIRKNGTDTTYANDYDEVRILKQLADELQISLLLVHHLRKRGDNDPLNKLSGTTGISGAVDAIFILDQSKRSATGATLICTGRDIEYRELELNFNDRTCVWDLISDTLAEPQKRLPEEMLLLVDFMKSIRSFSGGNTEFADLYNAFSGKQLSTKALKQQMNLWRYLLEQHGVTFENHRSNGQRLVSVVFSSAGDESDGSDVETGVCEPCVPVVPCDLVAP